MEKLCICPEEKELHKYIKLAKENNFELGKGGQAKVLLAKNMIPNRAIKNIPMMLAMT